MNEQDLALARSGFERCWPMLERALDEHPGRYRKQDVWQLIETGQSLIWPLKRSAVITSIRVYPTGLKEMWGWLAAGDLDELKQFEPILSDTAKKMGCAAFVLSGRAGWARALNGFSKRGTILIKDL